MLSDSKFEEIKASGNLPSPKGVAMRVMELTGNDNASIKEIAHAIKADPALSSRILKVANVRVAYQTRPIASIVDAVTVLGLNTVRELVLGLSLMEHHCDGACQAFNYQDFWSHSLLTAITAQNLVLHSGVGSTEEVFILGLMGQIGSLALATVYPQEYSGILGAVAENVDIAKDGVYAASLSGTGVVSELISLEDSKFGFNHSQLTQAMLADWGMPQVFQEISLHYENPGQSHFVEGSRGWHLLNILHIADLFSKVCLAKEPQQRKLVSKLILIASRHGLEIKDFAMLGDKSVREWNEWSKLCGLRSVKLPPFATLLEAVPLVPGMVEIADELISGAGTFYKLRILLVDDDQAILLLLKKLLEKAGHTVVTANNGMEGLGLIEEFMPQLIITDWIMPEMDGIGFCKMLRQNPLWRNIYVFIMTAQEGVDSLVEAFDAGANDYITKPVSPKVLLARLRAGQRVVQLQDEMEFDHQQLHKFSDELAAFNHRLRKSDVTMCAILENSPFMTWLKDADGRYIRVNQAFVGRFQWKDTQQIIGKTDRDLYPKELAEKYRINDVEVMTLRQQKRIEESLVDGNKIRWLETFRTPVIDENGKVLGTTGFAQDITQRKQAEADLRIAATAFESQEGMMITDANITILRINRAFTEITGYTAKEAVGQTPRLLKSGRHDAAFYAAMWKALKRDGSWQGEVWNRRKSGEVYPERLTITEVKGENRKITHYVATLHDITERKRMEKKIVTLAYIDELTQLPNRRLLNDRLSQAMATSKRSGCYGALMFLDLDKFKLLNDMHGHSVGDLLLIEAARRINSCVREADTVARFAGDEFVVMLSELDKNKAASILQARNVAEKIRITLAEPYILTLQQEKEAESIEHHCTSSIGVALFIGHEISREEILKCADMAMYQAKEGGRNLIHFFDQQS